MKCSVKVRLLFVAVSLVLVTGFNPALAQDSGADDILNPKPVVMLLVDTSGSMEYEVTANKEGVVPVCHTTKQSGYNYKKSRWTVATEVLTGSFNDYWCTTDYRTFPTTREDYQYYIPHSIPKGTLVDGSIQKDDGLIDIYGDVIKFGFMAFDPIKSTRTDAVGGYSYGPIRSSSNYGARNELAPWGAMVVPSVLDDMVSMQFTNSLVQSQILASVPYQGTPISPLLDDAYYFFTTDPRIKKYDPVNKNGDVYWDCRKKAIVLVTDGQPTTGEGDSGYKYSHVVAAQLLSLGIKVYVVGFQMPAGTSTVLDKIAKAGGTDVAYRATNQAELNEALGEVLMKVLGNEPSEVRTTVTNRTMNTSDKQYQFNVSYSGSLISFVDLVGNLDQFIYRCDSACKQEGWDDGAPLCEVFSISDALNQRSDPRTVLTQLGGAFTEFVSTSNLITPDLLGIPITGQLPKLDPTITSSGRKVFSGVVLGEASNPSIRAEYTRQLVRLVRGDSGTRRETIKFGAVLRSEPVIQPNLFSVAAPVPSFNLFRQKEEVRMRPTVMFVGTHDGQLHAFRVDRHASLDESEYGKELWAYIPKGQLTALNGLAWGAPFLMDGAPAMTDVRLQKLDALADVEEEAELWRSVLVAGYGRNGRGYTAFNVTDPTDPGLYWEFSPTEKCLGPETGSTQCFESDDFALLGYTTGTPAIGSAYVDWNGTTQERALVILGGGDSVSGVAQSGKVLYVVDLATGEVLEEFCNDCGNVDDSAKPGTKTANPLDCPLIGNVGAHDTFVGGLMSRAFIGDSCGQVWRLNMASSNTSDWKLEFFHDSWHASIAGYSKATMTKTRPVVWAPALATSPVPGQLTVVFATGEPGGGDRFPGSRDRVWSLQEYWNGSGFESRVNWVKQFSTEELTMSAPIVFDQVAYFTSVVTTDQYCDKGYGRLWGVDYDGTSTGATDDVVGKLDQDADPMTNDKVLYVEYPYSRALGMQIIQRPSCVESESEYTPWMGTSATDGATVPQTYDGTTGGYYGHGTNITGGFSSLSGSSSGTLDLIVQTGETGVSSPKMSPPEGGGATKTGNKAVQELAPPAQSVFSMSWGLIFD